VDPLPELDDIDHALIATLRAEWKTADPDRKKVIESEVASLQGGRP
jgi:hypothetical protein